MHPFVHLRVHSTYSIRHGLANPKQIIDWAVANNSQAIALTDEANLYAAIKFSQAASNTGIKPIFGIDVSVCDKYASSSVHKVTLLVKNEAGYKNLSYISTQSLTAGAAAMRRGQVEREFLVAHSEGLLVLGGAALGDVGYHLLNGNEQMARDKLQWWMDIYGDNYYLEIQRLGLPNEEVLNLGLLKLAQEYKCPPLATNNVMFMVADDYESHRARVNINRSEIMYREREPHSYQESQYMKSSKQMAELFADIPAAIENTYYAAQRCNFIIQPQQNLPHYPFAKGESKKDMLARLSSEGLKKLMGPDWESTGGGQYQQRLTMELQVIDEMNYNDYFLIVSDFVNWAKQNNIPVGPGRGSGGGSLVAYATSITALDPLEHNLLFERFLNQGRGSMPDFDIDVCMERRDEVINYLQQTFGRENAVQIVSFGTMGAKAVIRDVNRVLGKPYRVGDKISSMIPPLVRSLDDAVQMDESLRSFVENDEDAKQVFRLAQKLEGQVRHTGLHAAGLVIAPGAVKDFCPLFQDEDSKMICQYDKDDLEVVGLVKFDVLGLRNLTVIEETLKLIKQTDHKDIDITTLPYDDDKTMQSIRDGNTYAVFQLESSGMRDVARRMQPKFFEDIVALIALYRPGPMELIDDFIENKRKIEANEPINYPDPSLEDILRPTYGIAVYQEQVMQMAQELAGFTLSQADILRVAIGKKKKDVMAKQREAFIKGAMSQQGYDEKKAKQLFGTIERFAGYGFNRSHSVGYGVLAYWTAYLKTHYPAHYLTANMTTELNDSKKIASLVEECRKLKINLRGPDINLGKDKFSICFEENDYYVDYSLAAIKGVGVRVAQAIVETRQNKSYKNFLDFCGRMKPEYLNQGTVESLVRAGAFSKLDEDYASLYNSIEQGLQLCKKQFQERSSGIGDMFGEKLNKPIIRKGASLNKWSERRVAREEHRALGFYLRHDPFDLYKSELRSYVSTEISALGPNQEAVLCGRIYGLRKTFNNNRKMYRWLLIDETGEVQVRCFEEALRNRETSLKNDNIIAISGKLVSFEGRNGNGNERKSFTVSHIYDIGDLRAKNCKRIIISADMSLVKEDMLDKLKEASVIYRDNTGLPLSLHFRDHDKNHQFTVVMEDNRVLPSNLFIESLEDIIPNAEINIQ